MFLSRLPVRLAHAAGSRFTRYSQLASSLAANPPSKPTEYGQPHFISHSHLLKAGELTPGIPFEEYEDRRKALMDGLPDNSIVVSVAAPVKYMSGQIFYSYRQDSNFWYLTGFEEPNSAIILQKTSTSKGYHMKLFSQGKDSHREKWDGPSTSLDLVQEHFRADEAHPISSFFATLKTNLADADHVYIDLPPGVPSSRRTAQFDFSSPMDKSKRLLEYVTGRKGAKGEYEKLVADIANSKRRALAPEVGRLRAVKSLNEQKVMRQASDISGRAHAKTMRFAKMLYDDRTRGCVSERDLQAHFEYTCTLTGSQRPAYVPVVASGANSLIIHYVANNHLIQPDEMVLFDGGCEYKFPRTYPISGTFTPAQRDLYAAILSAQKQLVALCTEASGLSLHDLHRKSVELLRQELKQLGFNLIGGDLERVLYPHYLSHSIGIDLHESAHFDRISPLKEGMVITVEPGIYVPPGALFPKHFHNLGIRIEDQVVIGKKDPVVLSVSAPKEIADVESACQGLLDFSAY